MEAALRANSADALLMCGAEEWTDATLTRLAASGLYLRAIYVSANGSLEQTAHFAREIPYVLTTLQWHDTLQYGDAYFGSAASFSQRFRLRYGYAPSQYGAAAAVAAYTLAQAIALGVQGCDLTPLINAAGSSPGGGARVITAGQLLRPGVNITCVLPGEEGKEGEVITPYTAIIEYLHVLEVRGPRHGTAQHSASGLLLASPSCPRSRNAPLSGLAVT